MPEDEEELEYNVYGLWKFEHEPDGVFALGRAWIGIELLAMTENSDSTEDRFDERVLTLREPFCQ